MLGKVALVTVCIVLALAPATFAATYGSSLSEPANVTFGCEAAPILDPITGAPTLVASGQASCTWRHIGYILSNKVTSQVPRSGRIKSIQVRAGANPAPLRLTILGASSQLDLVTGQELAGTFSCCTARYLGPVFKPRANAITRRRTNVRVVNTIDRRNLVRVVDVVALSAVGPGTLPLRDQGVHGSYQTGAALAGFYYPLTERGQPRVEGASMDGYDLLLRWTLRSR